MNIYPQQFSSIPSYLYQFFFKSFELMLCCVLKWSDVDVVSSSSVHQWFVNYLNIISFMVVCHHYLLFIWCIIIVGFEVLYFSMLVYHHWSLFIWIIIIIKFEVLYFSLLYTVNLAWVWYEHLYRKSLKIKYFHWKLCFIIRTQFILNNKQKLVIEETSLF